MLLKRACMTFYFRQGNCWSRNLKNLKVRTLYKFTFLLNKMLYSKSCNWWPCTFWLLIYHSEGSPSGSTSYSGKDHHIEEETNNSKSLERSNEKIDARRLTEMPYSTDVDQQAENFTRGVHSTTFASWSRGYMKKFWSLLRSQNYLPLALVITFAVIFLMQVCSFFYNLSAMESKSVHLYVPSMNLHTIIISLSCKQ